MTPPGRGLMWLSALARNMMNVKKNSRIGLFLDIYKTKNNIFIFLNGELWTTGLFQTNSQNFRLFHVPNLSVRNFRIFLLMHTGSVIAEPLRPGPATSYLTSDIISAQRLTRACQIITHTWITTRKYRRPFFERRYFSSYRYH